jgi:ABC-type multidrug transport system fused ATPase/permease subunit
MDSGHIVASGSHAELQSTAPVYQRLVRAQVAQ